MRYKITLEYDGTNLLGWQEQLDGPSVQNYIQQALSCFAPATKETASIKQIDNTPTSISPLNSKETPPFIPPLNSKERLGGDYSSAERCKNASTGVRPQKSDTDSGKDFSEAYEGVSTERRPATYIEVREDASTGVRPQKPDKILVQGAGRTDAGVHATAQAAHFDLQADIADWKLREALNARLRDMEAPVSILTVEKVGTDFNARFSAKGRAYLYRILNRRAPAVLEKDRVWWVPVPLDVNKMREAAQYLIGHHDFSSFRAAACQAKSPVKTLDKLDIEVHGEEIHFIVEARSFLHHQVRNMVGTLKMVGDGHLQPADIKQILEARQRAAAGVTAPACGLYLTKVVY